MQIEVKFSGGGLDQFAAKLAQLGAQAGTEMARGLNDAGDKIRTQVRKALKDQMGVIKYAVVVDATSSIPASPSALVYRITGTGRGLPIKDFPVSASSGGPVTASPWGVAHTFQKSFKTTRTGRLLARRTSARFPVRSLRGPSPAKELVKDQSLATFEASVPAIVEPTVMARLSRLMP